MGNVFHVPGTEGMVGSLASVFLASLMKVGGVKPKYNTANVIMCEAKKILSQATKVLFKMRMECGITRIGYAI